MDAQPVHRRSFHAFISHAHADKRIVDGVYAWLSETAGLPVWYDSVHLPASTPIGAHLPEVIAQCRAMIIVLSRTSIQSGWVQEEYNAAVGQRARFRDYRIIPVRIEDCGIPECFQSTKWVDMVDGSLSVTVANELLGALYGLDLRLESRSTRDIYVSRSWRQEENRLADYVCQLLDAHGFRLIGDAKDQVGFDVDRIRSIMESCGGFVGILPDRGAGVTSPHILREVAAAQSLDIPSAIVAESAVGWPDEPAGGVVRVSAADDLTGRASADMLRAVADLEERWCTPTRPHYVFFGTDFDRVTNATNQALKQAVQRVSAMPCLMGEDIREGAVQQTITDRIRQAFLMVADISKDNLNTCIEAGIARGAGTPCYLVAREPRHRPAFMFRDQQVWFYKDDTDLLGVVHRILRPYRRRVVNHELPMRSPGAT